MFDDVEDILVVLKQYGFCHKSFRKRLEVKAMVSPFHAFCYAKYILQSRWPEGEALIGKAAVWSYFYARDIMQGRFELGEAAIATNTSYSIMYCKRLLHITNSIDIKEWRIRLLGGWSHYTKHEGVV